MDKTIVGVAIAKKTDPDLIVTAKTAPEENASTVILKKNGFQQRGVIQDHDIGNAWEWVFNVFSAL